MVCWGPAGRLATVLAGSGHGLGLADGSGSLAVLRSGWHRTRPFRVLGTERCGDSGDAERDLLGLIDDWRAAGRPELEDFEVRVAFGSPPRGATWRLPSAGEARIVALRPSRPGPPRGAPAPRP